MSYASEKPKVSVKSSRKQASFILKYYRPHLLKTIVSLTIMLLATGISLLYPKLLGLIFDAVLHPDRAPMSVATLAWALTGLLIVPAVIRYYFSIQLVRITENIIAEIRSSTFGHILRLPMSFFAENRVGELISRIKNDLAAIQETLTFTLLEMLRQTIFLVGGIIFIMTQSLPLTIPILIAMPVLIAIAVLFGRKIRTYSRRTQDALAASATITEEALQAIVSVKSYSNETYETSRYRGALNVTVGLAVATAKLRSAFVSFIIFAFFGGIAGVVWYGVSLVRKGDITLGDFATFLIYAMFVGGAMGSFAELFAQVQKALGATGRVQEILDMETEPTNASDASITLRSVRFEHVSFSYSTRREAPALRDVSFELRAGERIAFVGESGAGKTTTAALIQRLYEPSAGRIFYDDISAAALSLADTRRNIGTVPQDIVLFGGTIAENIRYGDLASDDEEVWRAAELANAAEFIERLPDGLQTIVGERGVQLSGGQRQRIAIARAILKNPPILILDEATSSLDSQSEYLIQEAIERLAVNRATVIIAHRLSTVRRCDKIYVFSGGRIVEHGTHDELSARPDSIYANLSRLQFS